MKVIDLHTHIEDTFAGGHLAPVVSKRYPRMAITVFERLGYRNPIPIPGPPRGLIRLMSVVELHGRSALSSPEWLLSEMARAGVTHSVVQPIEPGNSVSRTMEKIAGKRGLVLFTSVRPGDPDVAAKLRREVGAGCRGLKLHPILQVCPPGDRRYFDIIEEFRQYKLPVLFHTGEVEYFISRLASAPYGRPAGYVEIARAFPDVRFIFAHSGMHDFRETLDIASGLPNVFLGTSFQPAANIRAAIERLGPDRVVLESDFPCGFARYTVPLVKRATAGHEDWRRMVLGENALRLIGPVD